MWVEVRCAPFGANLSTSYLCCFLLASAQQGGNGNGCGNRGNLGTVCWGSQNCQGATAWNEAASGQGITGWNYQVREKLCGFFLCFLSLEVFGLLYVSSFGIYSNKRHAMEYYVTFGKNELDLYQLSRPAKQEGFYYPQKSFHMIQLL